VFSTLSVIGLRRLTIYNFYLTNIFCILNGTHQKMPPKTSTRANPAGKEDSNIQPLLFITPAQARKTTRKNKLVQNKVLPAIVTPLKSQVKKVTPAAKKKKVQVGAKKLCAVMNVKTGAVREVTSTKTGMNFIKQVNRLSDEEFKLFEFDTKEALIAASVTKETNANPATAKSVQAATPPLATPISLGTSTPKQHANLKRPPTSNPLADLKQQSHMGSLLKQLSQV
jgi:hypothetical protein